jgi:hypothetical protein
MGQLASELSSLRGMRNGIQFLARVKPRMRCRLKHPGGVIRRGKKTGGAMGRERALKIVLVQVGLFLTAAIYRL